MRFRIVVFAACAFSAATIAPSVAWSQTPVSFSGAGALALPIGDLGQAAEVGFNLALRGEARLAWQHWSVRGDLSWDRFGGRGNVDAYSYLGAAANVVHRSGAGRMYEFGGFGLYGERTTFTSQLNRDDTTLGLQAGIGVDLTPGPHTPFVEFGVTNVFTSGGNTFWFPVRFGVRF
jgi:hypothetical protein